MEASELGKPNDSKPIRDIAYEVLKKSIILGEIPAGSRIVETDYSNRMHISRTPLREALRRLERDGLVEYQPRRGVVVRAFTIQDVEEIYTIRNALEMLTLPAIIKNATAADIAHLRAILNDMDPLEVQNDIPALSPRARMFHSELTAICAQKRIIAAIEAQDEFIRRFSSMAISHENRRHSSQIEHHKLVDYVEAGDLENLDKLMRKHIERSKQNCLLALQENASKRKDSTEMKEMEL